MITGRQIREARALLRLDQSRLVTRAKIVTRATLTRAEAADGEPPITTAQAAAIQQVLELAGIEFVPESGSVKLRRQDA